MLFTRCPECDTTFRITADALRKADGQVRCGRCACVFNAYTELRRSTSEAYCDSGVVRKLIAPPAPAREASGGIAEATGAAVEASTGHDRANATEVGRAGGAADAPRDHADAPESDDGLDDAAETELESAGAARSDADDAVAAETDLEVGDAAGIDDDAVAPKGHDERGTAADDDGNLASTEPTFEGITVENVIEEVEASTDEPSDITTSEIESDASSTETENTQSSPTFVVLDEERAARPTRKWTFGCIAAALLLALQVTHHYRAQLAATAVVGPWLQKAYAFLGSEVTPHWDLAQYEILDWTAVAEPNAEGQGSLTIAARIFNRGPRTQPFPHIHVQLKDRWEQTVGSRIFSPSEYLAGGARATEMHAGRTARAQLTIVDPGPDAYGFELDVCIPRGSGELVCAADEVFR